MGIDSLPFLSCFLPLLALLHALLRGTHRRNVLLLAASLVFYAFCGLRELLLMLLCASVTYGFGLLLRRDRLRKPFLVLAVALELAFLAAFKYGRLLPGGDWLSRLPEGWRLSAPLGISFFVFKSISYLVDVYRRPETGTRCFPRLLLYLFFFPQVTAGPLSRYSDFAVQLAERSVSAEGMALGFRRFLMGLGKKLLLASAAARVTDTVFALSSPELDWRLGWLGALAYLLQIYFDFSAYSDMALGLGTMFGITGPENFAWPYAARSVSEFWRRWHISLSHWFRDYLYLPLGGNRKGRLRTAWNKLLVFALCGLWHGASWTFLVWGLWHGLLCAAESLSALPKRLEARPRRWKSLAARLYTLLAVTLGFVLFRASSFEEAWRVLSAMFGAFPVSPASTVRLFSLATWANLLPLLLCALFSAPLGTLLRDKARLILGARRARLISLILCLPLLALCLAALASGGFSPFIYAQF